MKGILITDMPDNCNECVFRTGDNKGNYWCHALLPRLKLGYIDGVIPRHIKCPLKPMPQELPTPYLFRQMQIADGLQNEDGSVPVYSEDYMNGWNECIDEVVGVEK